MELKSVREWAELLLRKNKMACNEFMDLQRYARTPGQKQAIRELLEMNRDERLRIERNLEARAKRLGPTNTEHGQRNDFDRGDGQDAGRWAGRLPR